MQTLIRKKRDGQSLTKEELKEIVDGFVSGEIPDYQMSAFLMAVYFKGMTAEETAIFTELMMRSGDVIDLSMIKGVKVDKHSTGGVGDKTTLMLAPLVAAAGVPVAKMTGRGLGHTGGTIDKLESIKGMSVEMSKEEFIQRIQAHGIAVCGQNANLVPADKRIYALRDVTGTVSQFSLIASSIMSKKLACGADAVVIDIKVGDGAFMKDLEDAKQLGTSMKEIGKNMGREIVAVATSMDQPLGRAVGNSLEVIEAIEALKGQGPADLMELCYELGSHMLVLGEVSNTAAEAKVKLKGLIESGAAFEKFKELVGEQGGAVSMIEDISLLPKSNLQIDLLCKSEGYVHSLKAKDVGLASMKLGAGRENKESVIDHGAGIYLHKKIGEAVSPGDVLATLYTNKKEQLEEAKVLLEQAYKIEKEKPEESPLILSIID